MPAALLALLCLASPPAPTAGPDALQDPPAEVELLLDADLGAIEQIPGPEAWPVWLARDARLAFTQPSTVLADRALAEGVRPARRACALLVLGTVAGRSARGYLEQQARQALGLERRAAVLALGEAGPGSEDLLALLLAEPDVADCALLALLRTRQTAARASVAGVAGEAANPLAPLALELLAFADAPGTSRPSAPAALLLALRWHAARMFGQVDGQVWDVLVGRAMLADRELVREVVLRAASRLRHPGARDHVLEELFEGREPARLRAAAAILPHELATMVRSGWWRPAGPAEWRVLLDEIDERGLEGETTELLLVAADVPEVAFRAAALLARARAPGALGVLRGELDGLAPDDRVWACEAMAASGERRWLPALDPLRADAERRVRVAALVAQVRLGSERARDELAALLEGQDADERAAAVGAMCQSAGDLRIADWLERLLRDAPAAPEGAAREADEGLAIATALGALGRIEARVRLRAAAEEALPRGAAGAALVRALARGASAADIELLVELYPQAGEREVNAALAVALIGFGSVEVLPLVRSAIWDEPWNIAILAAGLLAERAAVRALVDELHQPPPQATSEDIRRLGFAIGEWGGVEEVAALARSLRYNSGHPAVQGALLGALSMRTR